MRCRASSRATHRAEQQRILCTEVLPASGPNRKCDGDDPEIRKHEGDDAVHAGIVNRRSRHYIHRLGYIDTLAGAL